MASAGMTWPPVPPPAIRTRRSAMAGPLATSICLAGEIQQRQHDAHVEEGLDENGRGDAEGEEACEGILREAGRTQPAIPEGHEQRNDDHRAQQTKLLGDIGEDEIRVRLRQLEEFLQAVHITAAPPSPCTHRDERLDGVEAGTLRILPWIEKGQHAG